MIILAAALGIVVLAGSFIKAPTEPVVIESEQDVVGNVAKEYALTIKSTNPVEKISGFEISLIQKQNDTSYTVEGELVYTSSEGGGIDEQPIATARQGATFTVEKIDNKWSVTKTILGPYAGVGGNWILSKPDARGIQFMYPEKLSTTYVRATEWPPEVMLTVGDLSCDGTATTTDGQRAILEKHKVGDREYCAVISSEGAAGSTYTTYRYWTQQGDFIAHASFTLQYPQCLNYGEEEQDACFADQKGLNVDGLVDRIISSIRML